MRRAMVFLGVVALGVMLALATVAVAQADAPFFAVSPIEPPDHMWGVGWAPDDEVAITIDDPDVSGAVNFSMTESTDGDGFFYLFDMPFDIEAGHSVTVTQGTTVKTHEVLDLTVTLLDPVNDIITGLGASNTETVVHIGESRLVVMSGDDGVWMADFSGQFDILPGMVTYVYQADADGDQTQIDHYVPPPEGWQHNPATGHDYLFVWEGMSWADAEAYAVSLGGHLVTINDAAEDEWLVSTFGTEYWIGLNDIAVEGEWVWASGEPVSYTNWCPGEPNDLEPGEDAVMIWNRPPIGWNDIPDDSLMSFVVEIGAPMTLDELLDDMVADGRLPNEGVATSIIRQAEKAPLKALTNHLRSLVYDGVITQQTMDQILAMVAS